MVDTWATVGSCAQIGKNVHISGGVGIGGVLEPLQANPVIIEDDCFVGARSEVAEGVVVERGAVLSMGVFLGASHQDHRPRHRADLHGPGAVLFGGGAGSLPGKPLPDGTPGPPVLRGDRQAGGRADPGQDQHQRAAAGLMRDAPTDPVPLAQALIRCPSVTPADAGALGVMEAALTALGFTCHRLTFGETPNLVSPAAAPRGPHFCYAGHTDVVPTGPAEAWADGPFSGVVRDGVLYGRGACDMKGGIAAFVAGLTDYLAANPNGARQHQPADHRRRGRPGQGRHHQGAGLAGCAGRDPRHGAWSASRPPASRSAT